MFTENVSSFFDTAEHATSVTYTAPEYPHPGASTTTISAIVDKSAVEVEAGGAVNVRGVQTLLMCNASDVPNIGKGAHFTIGSDIFTVNDYETDETEAFVTAYLTKEP